MHIPSGYRIATRGEASKAKHAACKHGVICPIDEDNHQCAWQKIVPGFPPNFNEKAAQVVAKRAFRMAKYL